MAVGKAVGYQGKISFDTSKPDGTPRKWMDSGKLNQLGWKPLVNLELGLSQAYADFLQQIA
jgi:GDP-L-fucose synthase